MGKSVLYPSELSQDVAIIGTGELWLTSPVLLHYLEPGASPKRCDLSPN